MTFLVAAIVVVGVLGVVNLLFSFGVIRRLREHTEILNEIGGRAGSVMLEPGQKVAGFEAATVDGAPVALAAAGGPALVGFFTPGCGPCSAKLPAFVELAREHPGGRDRVFAVVLSHDDAEAAPYVQDLAAVAQVVRGVEGGPMPKAFGVQGFPAFAVVDADSVVLASGSELPDLAAANVRP